MADPKNTQFHNLLCLVATLASGARYQSDPNSDGRADTTPSRSVSLSSRQSPVSPYQHFRLTIDWLTPRLGL